MGLLIADSPNTQTNEPASILGFLEDSPFGSYLLGALGAGLICYGIFSFIRARYERF